MKLCHGLAVVTLDQGVLALAAWPSPRRQKIRLYRPMTGPRHCWTVGHRFQAAKCHPQAHMREKYEGHRWPVYICQGRSTHLPHEAGENQS
jgi:hypothetical protein